MPIPCKEIKPPQKSVSKLLSTPKIYGESKKKKQTKHTQINTSKSNTHILNKIKTLYSGELFWLALFITA